MTLYTIQKRRAATSSAWTTANPILVEGQWGIEINTGKAKLGDGATAWTGLPYFSNGALIAAQIAEAASNVFVMLEADQTEADIPEETPFGTPVFRKGESAPTGPLCVMYDMTSFGSIGGIIDDISLPWRRGRMVAGNGGGVALGSPLPPSDGSYAGVAGYVGNYAQADPEPTTFVEVGSASVDVYSTTGTVGSGANPGLLYLSQYWTVEGEEAWNNLGVTVTVVPGSGQVGYYDHTNSVGGFFCTIATEEWHNVRVDWNGASYHIVVRDSDDVIVGSQWGELYPGAKFSTRVTSYCGGSSSAASTAAETYIDNFETCVGEDSLAPLGEWTVIDLSQLEVVDDSGLSGSYNSGTDTFEVESLGASIMLPGLIYMIAGGEYELEITFAGTRHLDDRSSTSEQVVIIGTSSFDPSETVQNAIDWYNLDFGVLTSISTNVETYQLGPGIQQYDAAMADTPKAKHIVINEGITSETISQIRWRQTA